MQADFFIFYTNLMIHREINGIMLMTLKSEGGVIITPECAGYRVMRSK